MRITDPTRTRTTSSPNGVTFLASRFLTSVTTGYAVPGAPNGSDISLAVARRSVGRSPGGARIARAGSRRLRVIWGVDTNAAGLVSKARVGKLEAHLQWLTC